MNLAFLQLGINEPERLEYLKKGNIKYSTKSGFLRSSHIYVPPSLWQYPTLAATLLSMPPVGKVNVIMPDDIFIVDGQCISHLVTLENKHKKRTQSHNQIVKYYSHVE